VDEKSFELIDPVTHTMKKRKEEKNRRLSTRSFSLSSYCITRCIRSAHRVCLCIHFF